MSIDVSVVIPTRHRPRLLARALRSVFAQTYSDFEIIVVVDGPDEATCAMLASTPDPRLRVIVNSVPLTAAGARNKGVAAAQGGWIAFLDDDDEWLPDKLSRQIASAAGETAVLISCRSQVVTPTASYVWPSTLYDGAAPFDEYLFVRRSLFSGKSFIQTSSHFLPRQVALAWPFRTDTPHDDWDFVLRIARHGGVRIRMLEDVLVNVYMEERRPSLSAAPSWGKSLDWLDRNRDLFTRRGYAGFCLGVVGARAAHEGATAASFCHLLGQAFRFGAPAPLQLLTYCAFWGTSQKLRRRLRALLNTQHFGWANRGRGRGDGKLLWTAAPNDPAGNTQH
jgi:glycosyltransferase involved in cell wall biosynthesis